MATAVVNTGVICVSGVAAIEGAAIVLAAAYGFKLLAPNIHVDTNADGGIFVSVVVGDVVASLYYHESKDHSATADGGRLMPSFHVDAPAG